MTLRNHGWRDILKVLVDNGFVIIRQRGSHIQLYNPQTKRPLTLSRAVPVKQATLKSIILQSGLEWNDFLFALSRK